jgi:hypothetical protein
MAMVRPETDSIIAFLNELAALDPAAMKRLITVRVPCNKAIAAHKTLQVCTPEETGDTYRVGVLGLLNGYAGVIPEGHRRGWGPIAAKIGANGAIEFFRTENL